MVGKLKSSTMTRRIVLGIALPLTLRTFQFFPGMFYLQEGWFVLCLMVVILVYPFWKMRMQLRFSWFEFYLFLLMFADVVLAAWQARQVFGQPLIYGILTQRQMALIAVLLLLANGLRCGMIELADIEAVLLFLAWGTALLYSAMRLLLTPANFSAYGIGFVTLAGDSGQSSFKLQTFFLLFGVFYYALRGIRARRARNYFAAVALYLTTIGPSGRGLTVCVAATLLYFLYRIRGLRRTCLAVLRFGFVGAVLLGAFYAIQPAALSARIGGFSDAFTVVLTGSRTQDSSANARIFETATAFPYIQKHFLLGNGVVSNQWQGGNEGVLGEYFYPADIGVVGILFSYGILGVLLFLFQYRFAWGAAKRLPDSFHSPLADATKAFILYTALYSLLSGMFVWNGEATLFFIVLLMGIAAQKSSLGVPQAHSGEKCDLQGHALSA